MSATLNAAQGSVYNEMFRELCSAIIPRVRVLVASRVAPPPALARFGASGEMQVLTSHELRLDESEIQHVLNRTGGSSQSSARLRELTDGWAVAVTLLAKVSVAPTKLTASALRNPEDDLQGIFDFLAGEVFERLDASTRELLLEIALLPSFTASMAVELGGRSDAVALLSKLHRDYLLVERHGPSSFRLHDLAKIYALSCRGELPRHGLREALVAARQRGYGVFLGSRVISRLVSAAFEYGIELEQAAELQRNYELVPMLDGAPPS